MNYENIYVVNQTDTLFIIKNIVTNFILIYGL